jgi:large subunit ribosomal protein L13
MGKHRPTYTPHIDTGDYVIVTNVDKVVFTGDKWQQKFYQRYSGHPGGQRDEAAWKLFERRPARILELAIQRMMPKNKIGRHMMGKLKLVVGPTHDHQAQQPIPIDPIKQSFAPAGILLKPKPVPKAKKARPVVTESAAPETPALEAPSAEPEVMTTGPATTIEPEMPAVEAVASEPTPTEAETPDVESPKPETDTPHTDS